LVLLYPPATAGGTDNPLPQVVLTTRRRWDRFSREEKGMTSDERITKAVFSAVDELNAQLPAGVAVEKSLDAPLYGAGGKLESLDFVTLIMEVEYLDETLKQDPSAV